MTDAGSLPGAVLFDFDGTFADTAPDLGHALNAMRTERGLAALPIAKARAYASSGARGLLKLGFDVDPGHDDYTAMRDDFLSRYNARICVDTVLFPGIADLTADLDARRMPWGIVTNKAARFTDKIVAALGLRPACVVSGDTTPHLKPHPASLLHAAALLDLAPETCWYLGDDLRDVLAARAAGMRAVAVAYGYLGTENGGPDTWNADAVIDHPMDLLDLLELR